ncbi:hypothetical protein KW850_04185 [Bacillus sp. sid0103]|uniref:hypothetical protein n=1 Tax=Bacillus sp. sid0103 TaxID=2856337 RepID=UPI001C43D9B9|nr:hypothetical protein [Bacillus sp. sid0103]MBV7504464.1 hypothetical protein [Bacillus sp. sid0103]
MSGMKDKIQRWHWRIVFHERYEGRNELRLWRIVFHERDDGQNPSMALENCLS